MKRSREPEEDLGPITAGASHSQERPVAQQEDVSTSSPATKIIDLDSASSGGVEMRCSLPPHKETLVFGSYDEFDSHYSKDHSNRCLECGKNLPSPHMLDLHHEECHDTFVALKREKGEHTFSCFVEGCERKCMTPQKRRLHLIDKHMYPKNFFFAVTRDGVDGRRSMLLEGGHRQRRSSTTAMHARRNSVIKSVRADQNDEDQHRSADGNITQDPSPVRSNGSDAEMDGLAGALSSLKFVPRGLQFGRGGGKAGFAKR